MASKKITAMPDWAGNQVPTDLLTGIDLSATLANQNVKSTLNDLFSLITKNITDGAVRFQEFTAPAVSAAGQGALYFDDTDKTFKGSRNGGAYDDLLFGQGANQQVGVFTSAVDTVAGYAPFTYNSALERLYISDTVFSPTMEISKTGTSPAYAKIFGGQGFASLGNWSVTAAAPAYLNFYRGANGPAYPTNGMDIGSIRFRPAIDASDTPTTVGGARIDVRATENATAGVGGGVGLTIFTAANGEVSDNPRFLINYLGAVMVGVNSATITTNTGAGTRTVLGQLTTYDADTIHQIGNPTATDRKTLVIQAIAGQTKALTEWQTSAGALVFSIGAAGSTTWAGAAGVAVSGAGQGRIYFDSGTNKFKASQNGGAYVDLIGAGGGSPSGIDKNIQFNNAGAFGGATKFNYFDNANALVAIEETPGTTSVYAPSLLFLSADNYTTYYLFSLRNNLANCEFGWNIDNSGNANIANSVSSGQLRWNTPANDFYLEDFSSVIIDAVAYFGNGLTNASPLAGTLSGTGGSGSNIAGAAINIFAGKGTGTGNPGTVSIKFARPGTTGSSLNTLSDSLLFSYTTDAIYQTYKIKTTTTAETDAAAIGVAWLDNTHATRTSVFSVQTVGNGSGLTIIAEFDLPTVAGDTGFAIYDLDNATVERVSVGAADSGGTGFKVLRIPN